MATQELEDLQSKLPPSLPTWPTWLVVVICSVMMVGTLMLDANHPMGVAGGIPYIGVVLIASFAARIWVTFSASIACIVLVIIGFYLTPVGDQEVTWVGIVNRTQAVTLIALLGGAFIYRISVTRQRDKAVEDLQETIHRLKVLHGILPICSCCKKIKTGMGEWHQLETYIQRHSEAEFTHGICNDCAKEHYGEFWSEESEARIGKKPPAASETKDASDTETDDS